MSFTQSSTIYLHGLYYLTVLYKIMLDVYLVFSHYHLLEEPLEPLHVAYRTCYKYCPRTVVAGALTECSS